MDWPLYCIFSLLEDETCPQDSKESSSLDISCRRQNICLPRRTKYHGDDKVEQPRWKKVFEPEELEKVLVVLR
jgi:hypothetical protein